MSKFKSILKGSYVSIIVAFFYAPLLFAAVFSFNNYPEDAKGDMSFSKFMGFSSGGWAAWTDENHLNSIFNSLAISIPTAFLVVFISLLTCFALWRQKRKYYKVAVDGTANIPLINPDIVTAVGLMLAFGLIFGELKFGSSGILRTILGHVVMILPFGITTMYPRSEKFNKTMMEASRDLGFGPVKTWFNTYFRHMVPVTIGSFVIAMVLSLDDFIVTRLIFAGEGGTIGTQLYAGTVKASTLAIGTIMMFLVIFGMSIFLLYKKMTSKKGGK